MNAVKTSKLVRFDSLKAGDYFFVHMHHLTLMYVKRGPNGAEQIGSNHVVSFRIDQLVDAA